MASELSTQVSTAVLRSANAVQVGSSRVVSPTENIQKTGAVDNREKAQENSSTEKVTANKQDNATQNVSKNEVNDALSEIKAELSAIGREINFSVDEDLDIVIVKVVDKDTEEVVRQIPSEEVLEIARSIRDYKGFLFQEEV